MSEKTKAEKTEAEKTKAEKAEAAVAETEAPETPAKPDPNELVPYMAPLLPGRKQKDIFGAVNGETFRIKRGVQVMVKRKFVEVLNNAAAQQFAAYQAMNDIRKQSDKPAASM